MYELDDAVNRTKITYMDDSYTQRNLKSLCYLKDEIRHEGVGNAQSTITTSYTYDDTNNRETMTTSAGTVHYHYNALDQLTQITNGSPTGTQIATGSKPVSTTCRPTEGVVLVGANVLPA